MNILFNKHFFVGFMVSEMPSVPCMVVLINRHVYMYKLYFNCSYSCLIHSLNYYKNVIIVFN